MLSNEEWGDGSCPVRVLSDKEEVRAWAERVLLDPGRERPVVGLTTKYSGHDYFIDVRLVQEALEGLADLVCIQTGDATWALTEALPHRLDVYGGAMRVWWPGLAEGADPYVHKLYILHGAGNAPKQLRALERALEAAASPDGSDQDQLPTPEADARSKQASASRVNPRVVWQYLGQVLRPGDVVSGRVQKVDETSMYLLVEILPGAAGLVPVGEVDFSFVKALGDFVRVGDIVRVKVLDLNAHKMRATLSIKQARLTPDAHVLIRWPDRKSPGFEWPEPRHSSEVEVEGGLSERCRELEDELEAALADRAETRAREIKLRAEVRKLEGQLEASEERLAYEPFADERSFLAAVRMAYARDFCEADRMQYPLAPMLVGKEFLKTARRLEGIDPDKIVEVAAQVAAGRAHEVPAREVHPLRTSEGGSGPVVREGDGAKAWRCALQTNTAAARRLHWWQVPGVDGSRIEFISVGAHDDRIPV